MQTPLRLLLSSVAAVATFYLVFYLGGALLSFVLPRAACDWIAFAASVVSAVMAARYLWTRTGAPPARVLHYVAMGSLLTGSIGFVAGFFGPMLLTPEANQGPMLGIFITGPLGFIVGGAGGAWYGLSRRDRN